MPASSALVVLASGKKAVITVLAMCMLGALAAYALFTKDSQTALACVAGLSTIVTAFLPSQAMADRAESAAKSAIGVASATGAPSLPPPPLPAHAKAPGP